MHAITRHREARAMLTDPRFAPSPASYAARPDVPDEYRPYLRTMQEQDGPGHLRLRRAVAPAFTPRRVERYRARIAELVDGLLADIPTDDGVARPPQRPRPPAPDGRDLRGDRRARRGPTAVARVRRDGLGGRREGLRRRHPRDHRRRQGRVGRAGGRPRHRPRRRGALDDTEIVTLIWHLVLAGQVPTQLLAVGLDALLRRPDQLAAVPGRPPPPWRSCCAGAARSCSRCPASRARTSSSRACRSPRARPVTVAARRGQPRPARLPRSRRARRRPQRRRPPRLPARPALLPRRRPRPAGDGDRAHRGTGRWPHLRPGEAVRAPDPATWRLTTFTAVL